MCGCILPSRQEHNTHSILPLPLSIIEPDKILPFIAPVNSDLYRVSQNQLEKLECEVYPGILSKGIDFLKMGQCEDDFKRDHGSMVSTL